jgi:4'-phosphopantetheinyl transferase EntD
LAPVLFSIGKPPDNRSGVSMPRIRATAGGEFVRRAAFATIAAMAVHDKKSPDAHFVNFLPLNEAAVTTARAIRELDAKSARWIAAAALRELQSEAVLSRLKARAR